MKIAKLLTIVVLPVFMLLEFTLPFEYSVVMAEEISPGDMVKKKANLDSLSVVATNNAKDTKETPSRKSGVSSFKKVHHDEKEVATLKAETPFKIVQNVFKDSLNRIKFFQQAKNASTPLLAQTLPQTVGSTSTLQATSTEESKEEENVMQNEETIATTSTSTVNLTPPLVQNPTSNTSTPLLPLVEHIPEQEATQHVPRNSVSQQNSLSQDRQTATSTVVGATSNTGAVPENFSQKPVSSYTGNPYYRDRFSEETTNLLFTSAAILSLCGIFIASGAINFRTERITKIMQLKQKSYGNQ